MLARVLGAARPRGRPVRRRGADAGVRGRVDVPGAGSGRRAHRDGRGDRDRRRAGRRAAQGPPRGRHPAPGAGQGARARGAGRLGRLLRGQRRPAGRPADVRVPAREVLAGGRPGGDRRRRGGRPLLGGRRTRGPGVVQRGPGPRRRPPAQRGAARAVVVAALPA